MMTIVSFTLWRQNIVWDTSLTRLSWKRKDNGARYLRKQIGGRLEFTEVAAERLWAVFYNQRKFLQSKPMGNQSQIHNLSKVDLSRKSIHLDKFHNYRHSHHRHIHNLRNLGHNYHMLRCNQLEH